MFRIGLAKRIFVLHSCCEAPAKHDQKKKVKLTFPILLDYDPQRSLEHDLNVEFYHADKSFSYILVACPLSVLCSVIAS